MDDFKKPESPQVVKTRISESGCVQEKPEIHEHEKTEQNPPSESSFNCPYHVPKWSAAPSSNCEYKFEVLKSGQIIEQIRNLETKAYWVFGRLPGSDIQMAHPTVSRYHAVLQFRPASIKNDAEVDNDSIDNTHKIEEGWYIYDLDSTHGTFINKMRIPANVYIRIKVGHMLKLGTSTRCFILQGPTSDEEPESELTVTELREARAREEEQRKLEEKNQEAAREKEGISWGMAEDADEETDLSINPYAITSNEDLFLDDPKKTLRGFFEREGLPLEYKCDEIATGSFVCSVELPIDDLNGRPIVAEVSHKGRKKECVAQCALEACRILDKHGILRQAHHEPLKRKAKTNDSDDDDDFLDRTGDIERKKLRKAIAGTSITLTYSDLLEKEKELLKTIKEVDENISNYQELSKRLKENTSQEENDLDSFMKNLNDDSSTLDKTEIRKFRVEQQRLNAEYQKLQKLIKLAKPIELLSVANDSTTTITKKTGIKTLPLIGKRNQFNKFSVAKPKPSKEKTSSANLWKSDEEEMEEDDANESDSAVKVDETQAKICDNNISHEILPESEPSSQEEHTKDKKEEGATISTENSRIDESSAAKKSRQRQRNRHRRHDVDIEDLAEHEVEDKYSKWTPPVNQSGDGITPLNKKFGY